MSLMPADACVACFHDGHPDKMCFGEEPPGPNGEVSVCGCVEYVTEEERRQIVVELS